MASTAVVLDIRANTQKALGEFKKFSAQLDNKFLISGLKLDVVRNALSQINKEFQRAIGEQGLSASSSLRAAENQAALLTSTFKDFSLTAAKAITDDISNALNQVAVTAGGTMDDVKAALQATPFISNTLSQDLKKQLTSGILEFQRDIRRAGLGDEFGTIAKDILSGQADVLQLINSASPVGSAIGRKLQEAGVNDLRSLPPAQRTQILQSILNDKELQALLKETARETAGYKIILEDLNTALFNPKSGIFGYLREVTLQSRNLTTNVFDETYKLVESVFGKEGLFVNFFRNVAKVFGIEDPLKFIIRNVIFLTEQFEKLNDFIESESFQRVIKQIREAFERTKEFFVNIYDAIVNNDEESQQSVIQSIKNIGESVREFISKIAGVIRGEDISDESEKITTIAGTLVDEIGKTLILLINEVGEALLQKAGTIAGDIATKLPGIVAGLFSKLFEGDGILGKALGGLIVAKVGLAITRALGGINRTRTGPGGFAGAASRYIFGGPFSRRGGRGGGGGGFPITGSTQPRTIGPLGRVRNNLLARSLAARDVAQSYITRTPTPSVRRRPQGDIFGIERRKRYEEAQKKRSRMLRERAVRDRRVTPSTSVFAGTINPSYIERRGMNYEDFVLPQGKPIDRRITAKTTMFTPPTPAELFPYIATDDPINNPKLREANRQRYIEEAEFNRKIRSRQSVRQRFSRRYGRRAGLGAQMAQLRRGMPKVGKAGLITGGIGERIRRVVPNRRNLNARRLALQARTQDALGGFGRRARDIITGNDYLDDVPLSRDEVVRQRARNIREIRDRKARNAYYESTGKFRSPMGQKLRRFGKGALIAGGITAGLGLMSLFSGPGAQAAEGEIDPMTGMPSAPKNKKMGAGQAWGSLGAKVAEGAMMGSMFGPWGTAIGGVIGAGISLMDEEVKNAIGESISKFVSNTKEWMSDMGTKIKDAVTGGLKVIKDWASGIDWKEILLDVVFPGRGIARTVVQSTGASEGDGWMARAVRFLTGAKEKEELEGNAKGANFIGPTLAQESRTSKASEKSKKYHTKPEIPTFTNNFAGLNAAGPALAHESRMSGGKAMVVNDKEFVIPPGGFSTLANLVALKNTTPGSMNAAQAQAAPVINISVSVSGVLSESDLEDTLREPVSNIVEDAYRRASATTPRGVAKTV